MRTLLITAALLSISASSAFAQAAPQTLDAQMERINANNGTHAAPVKTLPPEVMETSQPIAADGSMTTTTTTTTRYQSMIDSQGSGAIPANPLNVQTNGNVTYVSGGISDEELDMMKSRASEFNLHIMMNSTGGAYIIPSKFHVMTTGGQEVLRIDDAGPYVYAKLTPGKYTIEAVENGEIRTSTVNVPSTGATKVQLTFKQQ